MYEFSKSCYCICIGKSRGRYVLYYVITILEIGVAMIVWFVMQQLSQMRIFALLLIIGGYFFGFLSMISYYVCFHPNRLNYLPENLQELTTTQYYYRGAHETRNIPRDNRPISSQFTIKRSELNAGLTQTDVSRPEEDLTLAEVRLQSNRNANNDIVDGIDGERGVIRIGETTV